MRMRKVDANGDMVFGHGQADYWNNAAQGVALLVQERLRLWTGQWFLNVTEGMPWATKVLGKYTASVRDQAIRKRILGTQGVTGITSYSSTFDPNARKFSVQATITTAYGAVTISGPI